MSVRLQRRVAVHVRRDAATTLSNSRVIYDALFSRTGIQHYGDSVEYRPDDEVFADLSLASGGSCPGVLLHPEDNFGTKFGEGSYPVRGTTGEKIVRHSDGIHTAGKLIVWCDEWNGLIERGEIAELSVGYTIVPDFTPGVAPDGTAYDLVHRDILWDHVAGVPAGNAGTARVVKDAAGDRATRKALAEIAAARMDARPLYHDLGQWPARPQRKDDTMNLEALLKGLRKIADAKGKRRADGMLADVLEAVLMLAVDNPDMAGELKKIAGQIKEAIEPSPEKPPAPEAPADEQMPGDPEDESAMKADAVRRLVADEVSKAVAAERSRVLDAADERADVLEVARAVFGRDFESRQDGKVIPTAEIMRRVVEKCDAKALARIDAKHPAGPKRDGAIESEFERVREAVADEAYKRYGDELLEQINNVRADAAAEQNEVAAELKALLDRLKKHDQAAAEGRAVQAS